MPQLPGEFFWIPWQESVLDLHADVHFRAFHDSIDAAGGEHVTGTISPTGVTLTDGTSNTVYRLAGASWFGGSFTAAGKFVSTDTAFFNILGPSGGPVAKVAAVEHFSSGGTNFSFNFGQCSEPQD